MRDAAHVLLEGAPAELDRDGIARDIVANVEDVREIHHMHVWSLDGSKMMATLHACLTDGADANVAVRDVKARLALQIRHHACDGRTGIRPLRRRGNFSSALRGRRRWQAGSKARSRW